jgi:heptosyltransferase-2
MGPQEKSNLTAMSEKILIIGPAWIGDMVMAQSLFKLLKQRHRDIQIDVCANASVIPLLRYMPEVSQAIAAPFGHGEIKLRARYQLAKQLRQVQYARAIVLPHSFKSALVPWLARIPQRTGWKGECRYGLLNDMRRLDKKRYPLMLEQYLALGLPAETPLSAPYPYPEFQVSPQAQTAALAKWGPSWRNRPVLALGPGAAFGPAKRWPETYFAETARQKLAEGWDVWLFGSAKDRPLTEKIMQLTDQRCENLAGRPELYETIALLALASGVITNDSGLMHIAAALGKKIIAIYGPTSPAFTPPLAKEATILQLQLDCQPCFKRVCPLTHHRCMQTLMPAAVLTAMRDW